MLSEPVVVFIFAGVEALDVLDVVGCGKLQLVRQLLELGRHGGCGQRRAPRLWSEKNGL